MQTVSVPRPALLESDSDKLALGSARDDRSARVGISVANLRYILHVTGTKGKTALLKSLARQLIKQGKGFMVVDHKQPELAREVLGLIPPERRQNVVVFKPEIGSADTLNFLSQPFIDRLGLDRSMLMNAGMLALDVLDPKLREDQKLKELVIFALRTLLAGEPNASFSQLVRFILDEEYRAEVVSRLDVHHTQSRLVWERNFDNFSDTLKMAFYAFGERLGLRLTDPVLSALLDAPDCSLDLRHAMDNNGIVVADLSGLSSEQAQLVSALLMICLAEAGMSRRNLSIIERVHWPVLIDDADYALANRDTLALLVCARLRAFHVGLVLAHQNLGQMGTALESLLGNAQSRVMLGATEEDAQHYATAFALSKPDYTANFADGQFLKLYGSASLFPFAPIE